MFDDVVRRCSYSSWMIRPYVWDLGLYIAGTEAIAFRVGAMNSIIFQVQVLPDSSSVHVHAFILRDKVSLIYGQTSAVGYQPTLARRLLHYSTLGLGVTIKPYFFVFSIGYVLTYGPFVIAASLTISRGS